jgi:lysophospholipase-3
MRLVFVPVILGTATAIAPVVIIPGDGSNQLEAKIDKPSTVSWKCTKKADWFRLWLDTSNLLLGTECWADNIKLLYDESKDVLSNNLGVQTRVPDFGGTSSFEELDPSVPFHATAAFRTMVQGFVSSGLKRNVTLRGAPYDFRYAPSSPVGAQYIQDLKSLVEQTVAATGSRVSLVSHSMGCLQALYFLNQQSQAWKDKFIEKWIPMAGPYGGAAKEIRLHASGDSQGLPVDALTIREEQRSYETNFWLAPVPERFGEEVLVTTPTRNYTAQDYDVFFDDIGFSAGKKLIKRVLPLTSSATAPGVDVVCMYSLGVDTPLKFEYGKNGANGGQKIFDKTPVVTNGDGDGTVNDLSLRICDEWAKPGAQTRSAKVMRFSKITHSGMLTDASVLKALNAELGMSATKVSNIIV